MLGVKTYPPEYVQACRSRVDALLAAYRALARATGEVKGAKESELDAARKSFESQFFNNMVLVLEQCFVHRLRGVEGKDGNPLNESRVLARSLLENDGKMGADKTIRLGPQESMLKYAQGETIDLDEAGFTRLAQAFFAEIEAKFSPA